MNRTIETNDLATIDRAWKAFTASNTVFERVTNDVLGWVTKRCKRKINSGDYDAAAPLSEVYQDFSDKHCNPESEFTQSVLRSERLIIETMEKGREQMGRAIFKRLIEELVKDDQLLYVYNRQQVRSHVAEMTRYFALMRQRLTADTEYKFAPDLVKMVKIASADRQQPIMGRDRENAARFNQPIRIINEVVDDQDTTPAWEFKDAVGSGWRDIVFETMETISEFFDKGLHTDFDSLAAYQARAFQTLYLDAVTDGSESQSHVITASTGGGKTEAFLFPILAYSLTTNKADIDGNDAVLTYPRQDLCNDQFQRLFNYVTEINRIEGELDTSLDEAPISISLHHGAREDVTLECPYCGSELTVRDGYQNNDFECSGPSAHRIRYATTERGAQADIIITTQNSLHVRLMDKHGRGSLWDSHYPTKFVVLDEVHIYTDQAGMNVANVVRRFRQAVNKKAPQQSQIPVASSATINNAESFTKRIFDTDHADEITPSKREKDTLSREHFIFIKATDPREVIVPVGDSVYKPRDEWDDVEPTTATNLSCMIQIAFAFQHTMRKEHAGGKEGPDADKDRVLGFVDSIDSVSRLGNYIQDAENRGLYKYRIPDAIIGDRGNNPDCPRDLFRGSTDDQYDEEAICETMPPNPNLNPCPVYEDGECWWTMQDRQADLEEMTLALHRSGERKAVNSKSNTSGQPTGDDWDQLITTSALEVGFDHANIIGTFQYQAPGSVPSFVQRKGRGGRDAEDEPISVVVFGSTPTDSFYFHHSNYLSRPEEREDLLQIALDENNRFIQSSHMTAAILDYFNVSDTVDSDQFYSYTYSAPKMDIDFLQQSVKKHELSLLDWLIKTFSVDEDTAQQVIDKFTTYLKSLTKPTGPDGERYIDIINKTLDNYEESENSNENQPALDYIDEILTQLETIK